MRVGVAIEETWGFFNEIYTDFVKHFDTQLFKRRDLKLPFLNERVNKYLFQRDLQRFIQSNDVVFFEWASGLLSSASQLNKKCSVITRLHRYEMYTWVDKINWDFVDRIILVSQTKQKEFIDRFPEHADKTVVIPVGISLEKFHPVQKSFNHNIGILCHLTPRKRVYELILSFYELSKISPHYQLHIGGGLHPSYGDYYEAILRLVKELNLQDRVKFYGNITDTSNWYHLIDIFISNSYSEGLQVAPMEAMASGCFCLSHYWEGADELLPQENLYFTSGEMIEKILEFDNLSDAEKLSKQEQLRCIISDYFNVEVIIPKIRKVVEEVGGKNQ